MNRLTLAKDLKLPADEAVAQKYAFIGRSGSGKTYGAMKLAELFLEAEAQVIVLDWVGNWWALRLAKDGKSPGFPHVYIFGGEHADAPLEATGGAMMADLLVDKHISAVLDLSPFRKGERTRFATAFAEQLFHRKKTARTACHLFLEEAQAFLPQMVRGDDARMVGVFEDIGKVGRNYGIGVSILSQRPQAVNKDVLNQTEVLLAFQTNGPQERKTIGGWVVEHGDDNRDLVDKLPTLGRGDAFVWSPQWLQLCRRIHIAERVTYDASSTPTQQAKQVKPKALTPADLAELGEAMKATVEKAKADDPRELRKQVADLGRQLALAHKTVPSGIQTSPARIKPLLTDADRELLERVRTRIDEVGSELTRNTVLDVNGAIAALTRELRDLTNDILLKQCVARDAFLRIVESKGLQKILAKLEGMAIAAPGPGRPTTPPFRGTPHSALRTPHSAPGDRTIRGIAPQNADRPPRGNGDASVTPAKQRILNGLAFLHGIGVGTVDKTQLALMVGVSPTSGAYFNNLGALRSAGLIEYPTAGSVALTSAGHAMASKDGVPSTTRELHAAIQGKLPPAKWKIVDAAIAVYPNAIGKDALAEQIGVQPTSGAYFNNLGSLRSLGLIDYPRPGYVVARPILFLD